MSSTERTLESVLIDWCDKHIAINSKYSKANEMEELKGCDLKYYDETGGSAAFSAYWIYLDESDKSYKVTYTNDYQGEGKSFVKNCKDIKEALMFVINHRSDWSLTAPKSFQMILNDNNIGYRGKGGYKGKRLEDFGLLHNTKIINMNPDDPFDYDVEFTPYYDKDFLLKKCNVPITEDKCKLVDDYYIPDLTKILDTDNDYIKMIEDQITNGTYDEPY